jgi:hypothetical protein
MSGENAIELQSFDPEMLSFDMWYPGNLHIDPKRVKVFYGDHTLKLQVSMSEIEINPINSTSIPSYYSPAIKHLMQYKGGEDAPFYSYVLTIGKDSSLTGALKEIDNVVATSLPVDRENGGHEYEWVRKHYRSFVHPDKNGNHCVMIAIALGRLDLEHMGTITLKFKVLVDG